MPISWRTPSSTSSTDAGQVPSLRWSCRRSGRPAACRVAVVGHGGAEDRPRVGELGAAPQRTAVVLGPHHRPAGRGAPHSPGTRMRPMGLTSAGALVGDRRRPPAAAVGPQPQPVGVGRPPSGYGMRQLHPVPSPPNRTHAESAGPGALGLDRVPDREDRHLAQTAVGPVALGLQAEIAALAADQLELVGPEVHRVGAGVELGHQPVLEAGEAARRRRPEPVGVRPLGMTVRPRGVTLRSRPRSGPAAGASPGCWPRGCAPCSPTPGAARRRRGCRGRGRRA